MEWRVMAQFKVLSWHLSGETEKKYRIGGVQAEIWTRDLRNTKGEY
jgi:hypothetical protein